MAMRFPGFAIAAITLGILAVPTGLDSCSIGPPEPVFSTVQRPADVAAFLSGRMGVIQPSYRREYLVAAYRMLSGVPFSRSNGQVNQAPVAREVRFGQPYQAMTEWVQARNRVLGLKNATSVETYKLETTAGSSTYFPNCLEDAFNNARDTLEARAKLWGYDAQPTRDWATAQDQVFNNCSGGDGTIPDPPVPGLDPLLASDRRYQRASAYFYAGEWRKAREAFDTIARETASPWRDIAPYLAARTFIREGTVDGKLGALREAKQRLEAIVSDPAQEKWHDASMRLLEYVRLRIDPYASMAELSSAVMQPGDSLDIDPAVTGFLYLFGQRAGGLMKDDELLAATSDLADWMLTFGWGTEAAMQ
jgi:tetratricopeptide (TPR) repeat protein